MALWTALGLGATATVGSAAAAAVVVIGAVGYFVILPQFQGEEPAQTAVVQQAPVVPETPSPEITASEPQVEEQADTAPSAVPEPEPPAGPVPPTFDVVRVDALGSALVAGIADADKMIGVLLDGETLVEVDASRDGRFVAMFDIPPSAEPRTLQLSMQTETGVLMSDQTILIAPFEMPVASASTTSAPTPAQPSVPPAPDQTDEPAAVAAAPASTETETVAALEPAPEPELAQPAQAPNAAPELLDVTVDTTAPSAPPLVIASSTGVQVLQPSPAPVISAPNAPTLRVNVTIDTISYDGSGQVEIAGRGQGSGFVRVYLNNMVRETVTVSDAGAWRANLPDIEPGIYTLRVDELDANGAVTSRFETPFKREDPEIVAAAQAALAPPAPVETETPSAPTPEVSAEITAPTAPVLDATTSVETDVVRPEVEVVTAAPSPPEPAQRPGVSVITVQPGFTLWQIAQDMMGQGELYVQVYEANRTQIRNPDLIYPGQVFTLPQESP